MLILRRLLLRRPWSIVRRILGLTRQGLAFGRPASAIDDAVWRRKAALLAGAQGLAGVKRFRRRFAQTALALSRLR